ncbi:MAG TPA: (Fe-S)-binding protein [Thermomicrobiaceae bacterium]|nr:(Fe-S)-binding protein [Thermomicrobiaceae bacterium]
MSLKAIALAILLAADLGWAGYRFWRLLRPVFRAHWENRFDHLPTRAWGIVTNILFHSRLLKIRYSGVLHLMIFSGFVILFTAIVQAFGEGLVPGFSLAPVGGDTWIALSQDVFDVVVMAGLALAAYNRYVRRPARFEGSNNRDATIVLLLIFAVVGDMLLQNTFRVAVGNDPSASWRPVSSFLAGLLAYAGIHGQSARLPAEVFYWTHVLAILAFLAYIPASKHLHILVGIPNVFFRSLEPKGTLPKADLSQPSVGLKEIHQLGWKQTLDLYACTECGRCQAVCPAYAAGQPLSPKLLIMDLRDHLLESEGIGGHRHLDGGGALVGGVIKDETLWACTTCRACMQVCPLHIEHVPKIVDMRRELVEQGRMEPKLQDSLASLAQHGNSFNQSERMRARWTRDLGFPIKDARKEEVDVLWFVGDFASYDPRVQRLTQAVARVLKTAQVDYGILYDSERNAGNDVRRVGEEGLFEMLAQHNIAVLGQASFKRIMTTDPHSLNALGQDYAALGAHYQVRHYTQLIASLLRTGQLPIKRRLQGVATYHDPCYLGRYNDGFDAPRQILEMLGVTVHEMGRCRENSFCCGAGGGRIWMDDSKLKERPSENRIREAVALGDADWFVVACPKDVVMYTAAVQSTGMEGRIEVKDVIELVEMAVAPEPVPALEMGEGQVTVA